MPWPANHDRYPWWNFHLMWQRFSSVHPALFMTKPTKHLASRILHRNEELSWTKKTTSGNTLTSTGRLPIPRKSAWGPFGRSWGDVLCSGITRQVSCQACNIKIPSFLLGRKGQSCSWSFGKGNRGRCVLLVTGRAMTQGCSRVKVDRLISSSDGTRVSKLSADELWPQIF